MSLLSRIFGKPASVQGNGHAKADEWLVPGTEIGKQVSIYDLICPLRYDILVRAEFIRFLKENDFLSGDDFDKIVRAPEAQRYQTWFREIAYRRRNPEHSHDESHFQERFRQRVSKVQALWKSMSVNGFDYTQPIRLKSGDHIREVNGKSFETRFYAGDGCHRIACLWIMGKDMLETREYEVAMSREFKPLDNTAVLLDKLSIPVSDYLSFIARGYCEGQELNSADEILAYVGANNPGRLEELKNVFRCDLGYYNPDHL